MVTFKTRKPRCVDAACLSTVTFFVDVIVSSQQQASDRATRVVGSVRVFHRKIYLGGEAVSMGGIGEVCTREEHRGEGIARRLLAMAVEYMRSQGITVSSLHAGPAVAGLYESLGYRDVPVSLSSRSWESLLELCERLDPGPAPGNPVFETLYGGGAPPRRLPWEQMAVLHAAYTRHYNGCVARGTKGEQAEAYWRQWALPGMLSAGRSLTLIWECSVERGAAHLPRAAPDAIAGGLLGYLCLRWRDGVVRVTEWVWIGEGPGSGSNEIGNFSAALYDSLVGQPPKHADTRAEEVAWPTAIMEHGRAAGGEEAYAVLMDEAGGVKVETGPDGFMYRAIEGEQTELEAALHGTGVEGGSRHVFWGVDGF